MHMEGNSEEMQLMKEMDTSRAIMDFFKDTESVGKRTKNQHHSAAYQNKPEVLMLGLALFVVVVFWLM
jgi:hypothetical protein